MGVTCALLFHPVLGIILPVAISCLELALTTVSEDIMSITSQEYLLYFLIIGDAVAKTSKVKTLRSSYMLTCLGW